MQIDMFSTTETIARDEALERVLSNAGEEWKEAARAQILNNHYGKSMTGEDMRLACQEVGIVPHHPNAWGGFVQGLIKSKDLRPTMEFRPMRAKGSHARMTRVYEVL